MKHVIRNISKKAKIYFGLPHFWVAGIVLIFSVVALGGSVILKERNSFWSSIFANIFAGLFTGLVISVISAIKAMSLYKTEYLIKWLTSLHEDILEYMRMEHKLMLFENEEAFNDDQVLYNYIYDTLCCGQNINIAIEQGVFKEFLPFNPDKYIKKEFNYDANKQSKENGELRDRIMNLDVSIVTSKELRLLFENMDTQLFILNGKILKHITELEARNKAINSSLM